MPVQVVFVVTGTKVDDPKISQFSLANLMLPFTSCLGCTLRSYMLAYVLVSVLLIGTYDLYPLVVLVRSLLCRQCMLVVALCAPCGGFRIRHIESTLCSLYWPVGIVPQKNLSPKPHILDSNGVWYSSFWLEVPKSHINLKILVSKIVPPRTSRGGAMGPIGVSLKVCALPLWRRTLRSEMRHPLRSMRHP